MSSGVVMVAEVSIDEDGDLAIALIVSRDGPLSTDETAASKLLDEPFADDTPEMAAAMIERLSELVPVVCDKCGIASDVAQLVATLRKGAILS